MSNNVFNPSLQRYIAVDQAAPANAFTIAGGAAAWIDTDISGSDVPLQAAAILWQCTPAANQQSGVRAHGETPEPTFNNVAAYGTHTLSTQSTTGHVDLLRAAADNVYYIQGYFI